MGLSDGKLLGRTAVKGEMEVEHLHWFTWKETEATEVFQAALRQTQQPESLDQQGQ